MSHASGIIFHVHVDQTQGYLRAKFGRNIFRRIRETDIFSKKPVFSGISDSAGNIETPRLDYLGLFWFDAESRLLIALTPSESIKKQIR